MKKVKIKLLLIFSLLIVFTLIAVAFDYKEKGENDIKLPSVAFKTQTTLEDAFKKRKTERIFASKPLSYELISNLLWSADGINRPDGKKTAPSALNRQEISLYVVLAAGTYLYDAKDNILRFVSSENANSKAPLVIAYVADLIKQPDEKYALVDCGFIGQNVYLFSAANNLNTVFKGSFDRKLYTKILKLDADKKVLFIQEVGFKP